MIAASSSMALGWALWATAQVAAELTERERTAFLQRHRLLLDRSTAAALHSIENRSSGLPAPSADYWEVKEQRLTLATAAMVSAGLESSAESVPDSRRRSRARAATAGATRTRAAIKNELRPQRLSPAPRRAQRQR